MRRFFPGAFLFLSPLVVLNKIAEEYFDDAYLTNNKMNMLSKVIFLGDMVPCRKSLAPRFFK
ncbi:MAG: hypothetical protein BGN92_05310 [Sphingobacteriales bacterium 41-5]|nr:MAG: hypothetical protein BGN92_05310 [Sphingobacteriales bacterium 41-5]